MIVPQYWAEGRVQSTTPHGRQLTVCRWGWSDAGQAAAQAHADARAQEAFERIATGESLPRREPKRAYNGAAGVPIREEIVARHGDCVISRNAYGARCLNTPDVLFVDVDFAPPGAAGRLWGAALLAVVGGACIGAVAKALVPALVAAVLIFGMGLVRTRARPRRGGRDLSAPHEQMLARLERFTRHHPDWHLRLYRTPAGFRVLAMHDVFNPSDAGVADCFRLLGADTVYARMCRNQNCFRARLSAKPWRIGIAEHIRPRPGVWPVRPDRLQERQAWVMRYEQAARGFAACEFIAALGDASRTHPKALAVQELHDAQAGAASGLPIA